MTRHIRTKHFQTYAFHLLFSVHIHDDDDDGDFEHLLIFVLISLFWCQHEIVGENLRLQTETDDEFMFPATLPTDDAMNVGLIDGCYYYFLLYFG